MDCRSNLLVGCRSMGLGHHHDATKWQKNIQCWKNRSSYCVYWLMQLTFCRNFVEIKHRLSSTGACFIFFCHTTRPNNNNVLLWYEKNNETGDYHCGHGPWYCIFTSQGIVISYLYAVIFTTQGILISYLYTIIFTSQGLLHNRVEPWLR